MEDRVKDKKLFNLDDTDVKIIKTVIIVGFIILMLLPFVI